jgi:hypothetical protein
MALEGVLPLGVRFILQQVSRGVGEWLTLERDFLGGEAGWKGGWL